MTDLKMTQEEFKAITDILIKKFDFDSLDLVEFVMFLEKKRHVHIPDEWLK